MGTYRGDVGRTTSKPVVELGEGEAAAFGAVAAGVRHRHERTLGRLEGVGELQFRRRVALYHSWHLMKIYSGNPRKKEKRSGVGSMII